MKDRFKLEDNTFQLCRFGRNGPSHIQIKDLSLGEKLELYETLRDSIFSSFGMQCGKCALEYSEATWWASFQHTIYYGYENATDDIESGEYYGSEVMGELEKNKTHALAYVDDGCGNKYYQVFAANNEITDQEILDRI
jgi:hypothetical protein